MEEKKKSQRDISSAGPRMNICTAHQEDSSKLYYCIWYPQLAPVSLESVSWDSGNSGKIKKNIHIKKQESPKEQEDT